MFDYVEIDSTFYRIPNQYMVRRWLTSTPENFKFTAKLPKSITHEKRLHNVDRELDQFLKVIAALHEKVLALLVQLPPSMTLEEGLEELEKLHSMLDNRFRYAVEVRHKSWFQDLAYNFFSKNAICMVWSQLAEIQTPPIATTDFLYLRFIGDRTMDPKDFGKIQKDRMAEMQYWASEVTKAREQPEKNVKFGIVSANNHYAGFGAATANMFRSLVGLPEVGWEETKQRSLSDFA